MSKLDELKIERLSKILSYIKVGIDCQKPEDEVANWLYHVLKMQFEDVERENRDEAIQMRTMLNGGYTKASH